MNIKGSVIAVTGAGRGLGAATVRRLAGLGGRLALLDQDPAGIETLAADLGAETARAVTCNVADERAVADAFAGIMDHFGRLDVLVNNAGITRDGLLVKIRDGQLLSRLSLEDWRAVLDVNLTGTFLCAREAAPLMANGGVIINVSSISRAGNFGQSNYSAAKAGVAALTVTWAKELARHGIRVNSISPGFIDTEMVQSMPDAAMARLRDAIPLGRVGKPDDIAHTVQFIIENEFVSGRNIGVDGAMRL